MSISEAKMLAEILADQVKLAESDSWECWEMDSGSAKKILFEIIKEFAEES